MTAPRQGKDGRPLVTTPMAAYSVDMKPGQFREWARRNGVTPAAWQPNPSRGQRLALWDLADIGAVVEQQLAA
ncbi:hypothetical protein ACFC08_17695 [Streptomyces sp. NPDC056112]|uniref:hypothetical protein n=1 Tax=Streptomyces sp. NPDC056112 TaxID=3345715 RepID=UPI0035D64BB7